MRALPYSPVSYLMVAPEAHSVFGKRCHVYRVSTSTVVADKGPLDKVNGA